MNKCNYINSLGTTKHMFLIRLCRLLTSTIWWWLVADLNVEVSDYVILCFPKKESDLDSNQRRTTFVDYVNLDPQSTYIDNDFHFHYHFDNYILCV